MEYLLYLLTGLTAVLLVLVILLLVRQNRIEQSAAVLLI